MEIENFKLSPNFDYYEMTRANDPELQKQNREQGIIYKSALIALATKILQPIREWNGHPLMINRGFSCEAHNTAVGGVRTSQHLFGQAADFSVKDISCEFIFRNLISALPLVNFGQFIYEKKGSTEWLHISSPTQTRKMETFIIDNGKKINLE
jgi:zinc D-Ala-D-Ala carboxypeptidase